MIPPVTGGAGHRILELREEPFAPRILTELASACRFRGRCGLGFLGRTR